MSDLFTSVKNTLHSIARTPPRAAWRALARGPRARPAPRRGGDGAMSSALASLRARAPRASPRASPSVAARAQTPASNGPAHLGLEPPGIARRPGRRARRRRALPCPGLAVRLEQAVELVHVELVLHEQNLVGDELLWRPGVVHAHALVHRQRRRLVHVAVIRRLGRGRGGTARRRRPLARDSARFFSRDESSEPFGFAGSEMTSYVTPPTVSVDVVDVEAGRFSLARRSRSTRLAVFAAATAASAAASLRSRSFCSGSTSRTRNVHLLLLSEQTPDPPQRRRGGAGSSPPQPPQPSQPSSPAFGLLLSLLSLLRLRLSLSLGLGLGLRRAPLRRLRAASPPRPSRPP